MGNGENSRLALPDHAPLLPLVYIDWNTTQHLRKEAALGPLLQALAEARLGGAALTPYSNAHLMDATAGWTTLNDEHRAERLRDLMFLEGISSSWLWTIEAGPEGQRHQISHERPYEACDVRGHFSDLRRHDADAELLAAADEHVRSSVEATTAEMRRLAAESPHVPPQLVESMVGAMTGLFANGLPDISSAGRMFTTLLAPAMLHVAEFLPPFDHVEPEEAVEHLVNALQKLHPGFDLFKTIDVAIAAKANVGIDGDDLGPMMLAWLGYHRDKASDLRRGAPGVVPDQTHAKYALSSAIFLTGEKRLPKRISAWAAHTGRGPAHGTWPLVLQVTPHDPASVARAVETVGAYTQRYRGEAERLWSRPDVPSDD